jgi:2-acylglycerol O-acyltransferase 2
MRAVDASRKTTEYNLKKGMSVLVYPGGSKEIFETDGGNPKTVVYVRTGFIRMALRYGCDLVPVFVYGEKHCYHRWVAPHLPRPTHRTMDRRRRCWWHGAERA